MARPTTSASRILACSILVLLLTGCDITLGPKVEKKAIIVYPGVPVEILQAVKLDCHTLVKSEQEGEVDVFKQDVGGWVAMPPEHWKSLKAEVQRLRKKCGEPE